MLNLSTNASTLPGTFVIPIVPVFCSLSDTIDVSLTAQRAGIQSPIVSETLNRTI